MLQQWSTFVRGPFGGVDSKGAAINDLLMIGSSTMSSDGEQDASASSRNCMRNLPKLFPPGFLAGFDEEIEVLLMLIERPTCFDVAEHERKMDRSNGRHVG